ncbi:MAG: TRAP transporter small permease subunit [Paracoccus sp. (in: a-proteobacteria)]|nr:TRAP transporter small permease subunit [Paracoccus sp. (in: a-proteobacteria)]
MGGLLALARVIDRINAAIGRAVAWLILLSVLVSVGNALVRYLQSTPLLRYLEISASNRWLELQWYLYGAAFLCAAAYTLMENEHIRIDVIYGRWSRRVQHWIDLLGHLFLLMPFVLLINWMAWPWFMRSYHSGEVSTNSGGLTIWPGKLMIALGFTLLAVQGVSEIIKKIAVMRGDLPDDGFHPSEEAIAAEAAGLSREQFGGDRTS